MKIITQAIILIGVTAILSGCAGYYSDDPYPPSVIYYDNPQVDYYGGFYHTYHENHYYHNDNNRHYDNHRDHRR